MKEFVLIIMKPDALERGLVEKIVKRFVGAGFTIEMVGFKLVEKTLILTHYDDVIKKLGGWFEEMVTRDYVGKGMIPIILSLTTEDVIAKARALTGATDPLLAETGTIRGDFGQDSMEAANREKRSCFNLIHCSDSLAAFEKELKLWFDPEVANHYIKIENNM